MNHIAIDTDNICHIKMKNNADWNVILLNIASLENIANSNDIQFGTYSGKYDGFSSRK